jgi:hypothetical protein
VKTEYTLPTLFTEGGKLFAEFPDGTLYGVVTRLKWVKGMPVPRKQFIRISDDDSARTPA